MPGSRHTRPRRRRDLAEAYVLVQREVTALRATVRLDTYEVDRLMAVIARLHAEVQRLSTQLATVRREIAVIRVTGQTDPLVQILAEQAAELREQLTASRLAIATMTSVPLPVSVPLIAPSADNDAAESPLAAPVPITSLRPVSAIASPVSASPVSASPVSASPEFDQLRQERPPLSELIGLAAPNSGYAARRRITEGLSVERESGADSLRDAELVGSDSQLVDLTAETIRLIRTSLDR